MMWRATPLWSPLMLLLLFAACGHDGGQRFGDGGAAVAHFDQQCTFCHLSAAEPGMETAVDVKPSCRGMACHPEQQTHHDPQAGTEDECLVCHAPHQSSNLFLIREMIMRPDGSVAPVDLTEIAGVADGGLASATDPGSGLCETCHTQTEFFRNDGTGRDHFAFTCFTCHSHRDGFVAE